MNKGSKIANTIQNNESDIDSLKKEHAELKKELQRLSLVIEGTKAGYWDWNIQTGLVSINKAWAEMIGYTQKELGPITLAKWKSLCHPDDLKKTNILLEDNLRGKLDDYEAEIRMQHKNGHWVWILTRGKVFEHDREGNAIRMAGSHQDITERKHAEEKLRQEINLFLEGPITVFRWLNTEGYPAEYVSPNVTTLTGYAPEDFTSEIIGYDDIIHPDDLDRVLNEMTAFFTNPESTSFEQEYRIIRKDGGITWMYDFTTIVRDENGCITRFEGYVLDNTLRKQSELAQAYNRRLDRLISTIANQFISASSEQIDTMINKALETIGEFVGADRSYIFQLYDNMRFMDNTHEWCAKGVKPKIDIFQQLPSSEFRWITKKITNNEVIIIPRVSELPDAAAAERKIFEQQNIKSLILIPLISGNDPFGFIGFDAVRVERQWPSDSASILALAGGIIANALQRQRVKKLLQCELDLALKLSMSQSFEETIQHCLNTAMEISGMDSGAVYLLNENKKALNLFHSQGLSDELIKTLAVFKKNSPEYQLMKSGKALYNDQTPEISEQTTQCLLQEGVNAYAILPVFNKKRPIALFTISSHKLDEVPVFARKALETVASHIGPTIMQARHEERISAVSRNLETLFESIDDMLFIFAENGTIVHANMATVAALGYSLDELRQMNVLEIHPSGQRIHAQKIVDAILSDTEKLCTVPLLKKSGETIPVETKITPGTWDGEPVVFGIARDISDRLKSQAAIIESEKKFRELTEFLPFPLFETNLKGIVNYINHSGMKFFDISPEELQKGVPALSFCCPENLELALEKQQKIFDPDYTAQGNEETIVMKDGRRLPLLLYNTPIRKGRKVAGIRTTVIDLTEMKRAEAALRESALQKRISEEFRSIIGNIPGIVYHLSTDNAINFLSDAKQAWTKHLVLDNNVGSLDHALTLVHPEDRQPLADFFNQLHQAQTSKTNVFRIILPDNEVKWLENRCTSVFSDGGSFSGIDGILFDITDKVNAQAEKKLLEENLIKTQRLETIGTLAGGIAHDFNNILTPILGYAEMGSILMQENNLPHDFYTQIMQAAERAKNLVSQILMFSRAEKAEPAIIKVQQIVEEAMQLLRPSIPSTISIETRFSKCGNVLVDPTQLHQVIMNLCTNAFQAMEDSGGEMSIDLREIIADNEFHKKHPNLKDSHYAQLTVTDNGHGMEASTIERIFEPFYSTRGFNKGTGLGLSVVHGIVTSFKGDITVESLPGNGSTFRIYLPVIAEELHAQQSNDLSAENNSGIRVLVVDDEHAATKVMRVMMNHLGIAVMVKNSPLEAIEEFRNDPKAYDLVITDLTMPEMTGTALARNLHKLNSQLPILLMTGYGKNIEDSISLNRYGIRKVIKKPVRLTVLAQIIREVLKGKSPQ